MTQTAPIRSAVPAAVIAVVLISALGTYFRFVDSAGFGIDRWWGDLVTVSRGSSAYAVAVFLAEVGSAVGVAATGAVAIALLLVLRRHRDAAAVASALIFGVVSSELLKALVLRPRPGGALYSTAGSSYPSGHSMGAAALAVSIALVVVYFDASSARTRRLTWVIATAWVLLMMWSRTALQVHWLSDTMAGALLGASVAIFARAIWVDQPATPTLQRQEATRS